MMTAERRAVIGAIAGLIYAPGLGHPVRVAIDGVTAAGKTTFADELAAEVAARGRPSIRISMDGYHQPRARRHRRGRYSAQGYYEDAYDFSSLRERVLVPLGPAGDRRYCPAIIDLASDEALGHQTSVAAPNAVLIVDGTFLLRPELIHHWDQCVFLNTPFAEALARGLSRDGESLGGAAAARTLYERRYHAACRLYLETLKPAERASIVVNNDDVDKPRIDTVRATPRCD